MRPVLRFSQQARLVRPQLWRQTRTYADEPYNALYPKKPKSPHIGFYQSFGRPIIKVILMSLGVYQLAILGWLKMEKSEERREGTAEVEKLETELKQLTNYKAE